jgi:hypothetical protein
VIHGYHGWKFTWNPKIDPTCIQHDQNVFFPLKFSGNHPEKFSEVLDFYGDKDIFEI